MAKIPNISAQTKEAIQRKSAYILPNNPTEAGFKASDIRNTLFKPILDATNSALAEVDRVINEINEFLEGEADKIVSSDEDGAYGVEYDYTVSDGEYTITKYKGTKTAIRIPSEVIVNGVRYPVVAISGMATTILKDVTIPKEILTVSGFTGNSLDSVTFEGLATLNSAFSLSGTTIFNVPREHYAAYLTRIAPYVSSTLQIKLYDTIAYNKSQIDALFTKITADIEAHNTLEEAHAYIRGLIATVQENLNNHDTLEEAHAYIRGLITAAQAAVQGNLDTHKASSTDHSDIRQSVTNLGTAQTNALNTHNTSLTSHANLLNRLSAVEAVASGKSKAWIFYNSTDLFDYLANTGNARANYGYDSSKWKSGDSILVVGGLEYTEDDGEQVLTGLGAEYWYCEYFDPGQHLDAFGNDLRLFEPIENTYTGYLEPNNSSDLLQILDLSLQASASADLAEGYAQDAHTYMGATEGFKNTAEANASLARKYTEGKALDGNVDATYSENNAKYYRDQTQLLVTYIEGEIPELTEGVETASERITHVETDITLLQKEVKDTSRMIAEANPNGEPRATVDGINAVSLPKNVTQGGGKVTVEGNTLTPLVAQADVAVSGTVAFNSVLDSKYYDQLHKTILTGTGVEMTVANDSGAVANIAVFDLNAFGLQSLTSEQCQAMIPDYFTGTKSVTKTRVRSVGKNSCPMNKVMSYLTENDEVNENGITATSTSGTNSAYIAIGPVNIDAGTNYIVSASDIDNIVKVILLNSTGTDYYETGSNTKNLLNQSQQYNNSGTATIAIYISSGMTITNIKIQIEKGTTATPYEPYTSNSVYLAPQELYSLPSGVKDTIDTNGVLTKRVKKDTASGIVAVNTTNYPLAKNGGQFVNYLTAGGMETGIIGTDSTTGAGTLYYELATPIITPNQATGTLIVYPNGVVHIENALPDGGLYDEGITILQTSYPIKTLERIQKITDGYAVDIDVSTAVVALDGLSFTHPDLISGDVIVFEYLYEYAGINGQAEVECFDSRLVIADTENGKFYKYKPVITNGVIASWALEEV